MSKTIEYLADQAVLMVTGGRPTIEGIDKREVRAMVRDAIPVVARNEYFENYKAFNQSSTTETSPLPWKYLETALV